MSLPAPGLGAPPGPWVAVCGGTVRRALGASVWLPCHHRPVVCSPVCLLVPVSGGGGRGTAVHPARRAGPQRKWSTRCSGFPVRCLHSCGLCGCGLSVSGSCERQRLADGKPVCLIPAPGPTHGFHGPRRSEASRDTQNWRLPRSHCTPLPRAQWLLPGMEEAKARQPQTRAKLVRTGQMLQMLKM